MFLEQVSLDVCFEAVRNRSRPVALLIGAGCSYSAGIPLASGFVTEIKSKYRLRCGSVQSNDYSDIAPLLAEDEWLELFWIALSDAKVNLAHLCIAELMKRETVDRVLTTNFDALLSKACALVDSSIAVCDCVAMPGVDRALDDRRPAVYHLHGQAHGMGMLNSPVDLAARKTLVQEIVRKIIDRRILIVCGYSGACDEVLAFLRDQRSLRNPVFWVPFSKGEGDTVATQFRQGNQAAKHLYVTKECDADRFFFSLLVAQGYSIPDVVLERQCFDMSSRMKLPPDFDSWLAGDPPSQDAGPPQPTPPSAPSPEWTT